MYLLWSISHVPFHFHQHKNLQSEQNYFFYMPQRNWTGLVSECVPGINLFPLGPRFTVKFQREDFPTSSASRAPQQLLPLSFPSSPMRSGSQKGGNSLDALSQHPRKQRELSRMQYKEQPLFLHLKHSIQGRPHAPSQDLDLVGEGMPVAGRSLWCCTQGTCWKSSLWNLPQIHPLGCQRKLFPGRCLPWDQRGILLQYCPRCGGRWHLGSCWLLGADGLCRLLSHALLGINGKLRNVAYSAKSPSTHESAGQQLF